MTREEAEKEIRDNFTEVWADGIIKALGQEPTTKNNLGVDAVSRKAVINQIFYSTDNNGDVVLGSALRERIARLPSVTPIRPKGHWIKTPKAVMGEGYMWYCDKCEHQVYQDSSRPYPSEKYCPNCGAKMVEPLESEDT